MSDPAAYTQTPNMAGAFEKSSQKGDPVNAWLADGHGSTASIISHLNALREASPEAADQKLEEILKAYIAVNEKAHTDKLTAVYSRGYLMDDLNRRERKGESWLLFLDMDKFKQINDTHGHAAGDEVLQHVAFSLATACKRTTDIVVRLGGDEFVVFLPNTDKDGADMICERIQKIFKDHPVQLENGVEITLSASIGRAEIQPDEDLSDALERADKQLYEIKAQRKSQEAKTAPSFYASASPLFS